MDITVKPLRESPYFSSSTGGLLMRVIRLQYQIMMMRMLGVRKVFMANHTLVKPPFWWIPCEDRDSVLTVCVVYVILLGNKGKRSH